MPKYIVLFILTFFASGCKDDRNSVGCGCDSYAIVKVASNAKGRVARLSAEHPDKWVIVSEEGIIGNPNPIYDGPDIVLVCDFPDSLKVEDQKVIFSGQLTKPCETYETWTSVLYSGRLKDLHIR